MLFQWAISVFRQAETRWGLSKIIFPGWLTAANPPADIFVLATLLSLGDQWELFYCQFKTANQCLGGRNALTSGSGDIFSFLQFLLFYYFKLYFPITVDIQYYFVLVSSVQNSRQSNAIFHKVSPQHIQYPSDTIQSYYNIFYYILYAVLYIPMTIGNYEFLPLNPFPFFTYHNSPTSGNHQSVLCIYESVSVLLTSYLKQEVLKLK